MFTLTNIFGSESNKTCFFTFFAFLTASLLLLACSSFCFI